MKIAYSACSILGIVVLSLANGTAAFANPAYPAHQPLTQRERDAQTPLRDQQADSRPLDHPENAATDEPRKSGRMSPKERRALRRQINEAGRDIYTYTPNR